ncbi:MAG TPA: alpha/beta hydrolase [Saprospiraceae bacterium]|nr:alpha/beta hydrolase [Saprospiraceae bacterium]HPG06420.1 alpha/beta hydrolase [Saprospiraceae bacterium]HRV87336.1 alpha/beta hydrolase [Saprospiraceae bacterium]
MRIMLMTALTTLVLSPALHGQRLSWRDILQRLENDRPQPDFVYPYAGEDTLQFGELWLPNHGSSHPVVVLIHGGCWLDQYPGVELVYYIADDLRSRGYAVWNLEYRRIGYPGSGYPGTFLDIAQGMDFLRTIAGKHRLDLDHVITMGHSAGGHLALWLAMRKNIPASSPLFADDPLPVHNVISLAGIGDLAYFSHFGAPACGDNTVEELIDWSNRGKEAALEDTSPDHLLPFDGKQYLIHGVFDAAVPPFIGLQYNEKSKAKNQESELIIIPDSGHFEIIVPWSDAWKKILPLVKEAMRS